MKKLGKIKNEPKVEKNLVLKATNETLSTEDEETAYIAKRVIKALKKFGAIPKKGEFSKYIIDGKANDTCHKCANPGHYIKDCPMHMIEYKEYAKQNSEKEKGRKQVQERFSRKVEVDRVAMYLVTVRAELYKAMNWTTSSDTLSSIISQSHANESYPARAAALKEIKESFLKKGRCGRAKESSNHWVLNSGYSRNMIGKIENFLSLEAHEGGSVSFGDGSKDYIVGIGKVGNNLNKAIDYISFVNGLKFSLLSVSQIYDKGNEVRFSGGLVGGISGLGGGFGGLGAGISGINGDGVSGLGGGIGDSVGVGGLGGGIGGIGDGVCGLSGIGGGLQDVSPNKIN
ncbi:glycine, alanine and asparagine-rich protein-like [Capsicum annuum]|uniref:glycine, alanine and asparagine-rich protein-like n=1 Tax=Capsicum annuum TaxID=4072 RepID=UPI001FB16C09|nr:glycine, alanine and asparagine-rich protein-like [Capsicum annuum]